MYNYNYPWFRSIFELLAPQTTVVNFNFEKSPDELVFDFAKPISNMLVKTFANSERNITINHLFGKLLLSYLKQNTKYYIFKHAEWLRYKEATKKLTIAYISKLQNNLVGALSETRSSLNLLPHYSETKLELTSKKREVANILIDTLKDIKINNFEKVQATSIILAMNILFIRLMATSLETKEVICAINSEIEQFLNLAYPAKA